MAPPEPAIHAGTSGICTASRVPAAMQTAQLCTDQPRPPAPPSPSYMDQRGAPSGWHTAGTGADDGQGPREYTADDERDEESAWFRDKKIRAAKRAARSELSVSKGEWRKHGYAETDVLSTKGLRDTIPRVHWKELTRERFVEQFERPRLPVVITGLVESWPAAAGWELPALRQSLKDHKFKIGSDDEGYAVRLRLDWFLDYCAHPEHGLVDDSPLYIFDGTFGERSASKHMLQDYAVPPFFTEDLLHLVGEKRRPPYRWVVLGPARSGSGLHIDPLATSAWNALVCGHKRWALFPPGTPKELVLPREPGIEREAISWFTHVYPRAAHHPEWPTARPIDLIQGPGEIVFIPGGWWHAVLNLDMTVAVTQNYVSTANFARVWKHARKGRPKMSAHWLAALQTARPDLAAQARDIDDRGEVDCQTSSSSSSSSSSGNSSSDSSSSSDSDAPRSKQPRLPPAAPPDSGPSPSQPEPRNTQQPGVPPQAHSGGHNRPAPPQASQAPHPASAPTHGLDPHRDLRDDPQGDGCGDGSTGRQQTPACPVDGSRGSTPAAQRGPWGARPEGHSAAQPPQHRHEQRQPLAQHHAPPCAEAVGHAAGSSAQAGPQGVVGVCGALLRASTRGGHSCARDASVAARPVAAPGRLHDGQVLSHAGQAALLEEQRGPDQLCIPSLVATGAAADGCAGGLAQDGRVGVPLYEGWLSHRERQALRQEARAQAAAGRAAPGLMR